MGCCCAVTPRTSARRAEIDAEVQKARDRLADIAARKQARGLQSRFNSKVESLGEVINGDAQQQHRISEIDTEAHRLYQDEDWPRAADMFLRGMKELGESRHDAEEVMRACKL